MKIFLELYFLLLFFSFPFLIHCSIYKYNAVETETSYTGTVDTRSTDTSNLIGSDTSVFHPNVQIDSIDNGKSSSDGEPTIRADYIDIGRNLTFPPASPYSTTSTPIVVEILIVCDKEFGDIFNHDRKRILDYFTVFFWDINMRYKTLPSSNISFKINGVMVISKTSDQPFIEESRASDGRAEHGRILKRFSHWIYDEMSRLPKFDMAVAVTNTRLEWNGGLAHGGGACAASHGERKYYGTAVWDDKGNWGSLTVAAHEMGHVVGAPHDDDPNFDCKERGHIMGGGNDDLRWFFSTCSDRKIGKFVKSNEASCLRDLTNQSPVISPDFSTHLAPDMPEQCRRHLNDPLATIEYKDTANCKSMRCIVPIGNNNWGVHFIAPVDNTQCFEGRRCFRGRCRKIGRVLKNIGSGQCARAENPVAFMAPIKMGPCPDPERSATPLDTFIVEQTSSHGILLQTPWSSLDSKENGDKCVFTGWPEGAGLSTDRCSKDTEEQNPWHGWDMVPHGDRGEFLLKHRKTKLCAKAVTNSIIITTLQCDSNDSYLRWVFL